MVNIEKLKRKYKLSNPAMITKPTMPRLEYYSKYLERIWKSKWMTNMAEIHQEFEKQLNDYLGAKYNSLFCNGTTALLVALKAFNLDCGEVITTPFTFPATTNVLYWSNLTPVFCDIEKKNI